MADARYRLLPVFSSMLPPDPEMHNWIDQARFPHLETLNQPLAVAGQTLYRRGNFNGTFDQVICEALLEHYDAESRPVSGLPLGDERAGRARP